MATKHKHHKYNTGWLIVAGVLIAAMVVVLSENVRTTGHAILFTDSDLTVYSSDYSGSEKVAVTISADVYNKGRSDINDLYVLRLEIFDAATKKFIYIEDKTILPTHYRNSLKTTRFFWIPTKAGNYEFRLTADYNAIVAETSEKNNIFEGKLAVDIFNSGISTLPNYSGTN